MAREPKKKPEEYVKGPTRSLSFSSKDYDRLLKVSKKFLDDDVQKEFAEFVRSKKLAAPNAPAPDEEEELVNVGRMTKEKTYIGNPLLGSSGMERYLPNPDTIDIQVYEMMREEPQIAAGLAIIKMPLLSLSYNFESSNPDIKEFVKWAIKPIWRKMIRSMLTAIEFGFASHEKVFKVVDNTVIKSKDETGAEVTHFTGPAVVYDKLKPHHPSTIQFKFDKKDNIKNLIQNVSGNEVEVKPDKLFIFTHEEEFGNPFGRSRLRNAYKVWYWKELVYQFMLMYLERRGSPTVKVTYPPGESVAENNERKNNADLALHLGSSIISNSVAAVPYVESEQGKPMWDVSYLADDKRGDMFVEFIQHLDAKCLRAIWVPERSITQDNSTGSYSMASVHADLFLLTEKGLIADIESAINESIIPPLVTMNFPPNEQAECYIRIEQIDWNRKAMLKEIFIQMLKGNDTMIQAGVHPTVIPDLDAVADALEIPVTDFDGATSELEIGNAAVKNQLKLNPPQPNVPAKPKPKAKPKAKK